MYKFKNDRIRQACLYHPSFQPNSEFQRLEFIGDKILSFYLSIALFKHFPQYTEGQLTIILSNIVNQKKLYEKGSFLRKLIKINCPINHSTLSDCFESWIGAIYIDGGDVEQIIYKIFRNEILNANYQPSYKNLLQEITQKHNIQPIYKYTTCIKNFTCSVSVNTSTAYGTGQSKKHASQNAAKNWLNKFKTI